MQFILESVFPQILLGRKSLEFQPKPFYNTVLSWWLDNAGSKGHSKSKSRIMATARAKISFQFAECNFWWLEKKILPRNDWSFERISKHVLFKFDSQRSRYWKNGKKIIELPSKQLISFIVERLNSCNWCKQRSIYF